MSHPIFARLYGRLSVDAERHGVAEHRRELLDGVAGRVIEIGAGNGLNFAHYPPTVDEVIAVEPEPYLRGLAVEAASDAPVAVSVIDGVADELPFADGSFDVAVFSLVLCSVPDPVHALREARRVVRPGCELRFYEHVRAETDGLRRFQRAIDVAWPWFGGGCHTSRDSEAAVAEAGFVIDRSRRFRFEPSFVAKPVAPHVIGVAHRPATD